MREAGLEGFRLRGKDVSRLEGFSDAVFGFALTLLVVSLDVPKSFDELVNTMRGFPAFALCFLFLALIWNSHFKFCRAYGLVDPVSRFLTCVMLFLVLFYVYPLKFLFNLNITNNIYHQGGGLTLRQATILLTIYGLGFAAVYLSLALLYLHAWRLREALELNAVERYDTRHSFYRMLTLVGVGILAAVLANFRATISWSGWCYALLFPVLRSHRVLHRRWRKRFLSPAAA